MFVVGWSMFKFSVIFRLGGPVFQVAYHNCVYRHIKQSLGSDCEYGIIFVRLIQHHIHPQKLTCPLKNDGWKTSFLLGRPMFKGYVSLRECILLEFIRHQAKQ